MLGLPYHARRGSDKRHLSDVLIADLLLAFDKLDLNDNLPPIYCEAVDLIMLPCLAVVLFLKGLRLIPTVCTLLLIK